MRFAMTAAMEKRPHASQAATQLVRYGLTGGFVTALGAAIYYGCAEFLDIYPLVANSIAWITGVVVGYILHSQFSFRGHGRRDNVGRTGGRFIAVNIVGFAINSLWVWSLVELLGGANWWPLIPMVIATPLITFLLHRYWTFG
ncbi:GtrA family protein [Parasphingopyxis algicola]|uniref:GtrA family protein n=1 Tax=Parasphingopyxis algicola TaxID=2026624 RepID=UPI001FEAC298|nr:GtrA family protein [Parasphingopyxis algicola]